MRRLLPFSVVALAIVCVSLLSRPTRSDSAPIPTTDRAARSTTSAVTTITTDTIVIPTYPYAAFLYTATNTTYNIPYRWLNWGQYHGSNSHPVDQTYTRLTLENDWLRVSILPELGGRIYEMIFKPTGNNEFYRNTVIKPTNWGPPEQGWWLAAGGLEWGLPVEEHGYETAIPWTYDVITGAEGVTVTLRDSVQPDRLRATISIFLPNDRAVLIVRPRIENDRNVDLNFKWWDNAMVAPGPGNSIGKQGSNPHGIDFKFVLPEAQVTVHSTGDPSLPQEGQAMSWPIYKNRDLSRLQNWNQWLGFFARPAASQEWVSVIDQAHQEGLVRVFPRSIAPGSKGFAMGWQHPIGAGEWTDDDSYYAELHGGLAPTFWDSVVIGAQQAIEWEEAWYPFAGLNDVTTANREAALTAQPAGPHWNLAAVSTRPRAAVRLAAYQYSTCHVIDDATVSLSPGVAVTRSFAANVTPADLAVILTDNDVVLASYNVWPETLPPSAAVQALPDYVLQATFPITLSGTDVNCVRSYDVQVRDGLLGAWTPWLTATTSMTQTFTGQHGQTYFFRARARDLVGNQSAFTSNPLGDTSTTILLSPAAVLELSSKAVPRFFNPGQAMDYRIDLRNTGNVSGSLNLSDTLPATLSLISGTLSASAGPAPQFDGVHITWAGVVTDAQSVSITYALTPVIELVRGTTVTNTVVIVGGVKPVVRTAFTTLGFNAYLPLILRTAP